MDNRPISDLLKELPSSNKQNFSRFKPQCQQTSTKSASYVCTQDDPTPPKRIITEKNNILMKVLERAFPNTKSLKRDASEADICPGSGEGGSNSNNGSDAAATLAKQLRRDSQHRTTRQL